ncbi:MAG TPA: HWE histidine kinase domain-containing protein [Allosphingosinicella sp.]|jgi:two-component sensor histidine kinase
MTHVFVSDEMAARPPKRADCQREKKAMLDLAARLADASGEVLPRFVELAMEITGGVSAGLSIFDADREPDLFRWKHLHGSLARFEGATTPRDNSPCGVTLDAGSPVLAAHPERLYDWIAAEKLILPEVLLVPLNVGGDDALGTLWVVADASGHFDTGDAQALTDLAVFVGMALLVRKREEQSRRALDEQEMVAEEMGHRLNNLFALTEGMIRGSARGAKSPAAMAEVLSGRLHALASAQSLVRRKAGDTGAFPDEKDLGELIQAIVTPHGPGGERSASPFRIEGPAVNCSGHACSGLALIIHELATNASKYGALKNVEGRIAITWETNGPMLHLKWTESGGPAIDSVPTRSGFGSVLAQRTVKSQFGGVLSRDWGREGLSVTMTLSIARLSA